MVKIILDSKFCAKANCCFYSKKHIKKWWMLEMSVPLLEMSVPLLEMSAQERSFPWNERFGAFLDLKWALRSVPWLEMSVPFLEMEVPSSPDFTKCHDSKPEVVFPRLWSNGFREKRPPRRGGTWLLLHTLWPAEDCCTSLVSSLPLHPHFYLWFVR